MCANPPTFPPVRSAVSTEVGQILDAGIYFNPGDSLTSFATPQALGTHTKSYDLESILTHELGRAFGFSHSAVWSAMMFPFVPAPGTYSGVRPSAQVPDAPLADDDPTGLRVLYPDRATRFLSAPSRDTSFRQILFPARVATGCDWVFGAHVVAVDATSGSVIAGSMGGWSCAAPGPVQFDGIMKLIACRWAAATRFTPSRWMAPLRRRK